MMASEILIFDESLVEEKQYWLGKLRAVEEAANLRLDYPRSATTQPKKAFIEFALPADVCQRLETLTGGGAFLLYTALMAGLMVCVHKYTGSTAPVIASPARKLDASDDQPPNALVIVNELDDRTSFRQFLLSTRQ